MLGIILWLAGLIVALAFALLLFQYITAAITRAVGA